MRKDITFYRDFGGFSSDEYIEQVLAKDENFNQSWDYIIIKVWEDDMSIKQVYIINIT